MKLKISNLLKFKKYLDQNSPETIIADGEWHVAIVDISSYNKWSFAASEDGQYRVQYVRFDPINGRLEPENRVDISYVAVHDNLDDMWHISST